ncbi:MAG: hypothetical protein ACRDRG_15090 [Pseudonocardiaceae bacterium]
MGFATSTRLRWLRVAAPMVELLTAILLGCFAWWCWHRGVIVMLRRGVEMNRVEGGWWAVATGAATLAGILLLDAGRRVARVWAVRAVTGGCDYRGSE